VSRRILIVICLALVIAAVAAMRAVSSLSPTSDGVPTTRAVKGDIDITVHTLGELGPRRSMTLSAPTVGGLLQIVTLKPAGAFVKEGEVVIEFDAAEQLYNLQQAESELAEAEQELAKLLADTRVQASTDALRST
jgi:multidrug efflux pump subunit AcrA (membrane-fusion protein)